MLSVNNLSLHYPARMLCHALSFTVQPGECWAILGQNGCGKTTLIHTLGGLRPYNDGRITLHGKPLKRIPRRERANKLGIMLQEEPGEFWGTVQEYVLLGRHPHVKTLFGWNSMDYNMAEDALERMDLSHLADRPFNTLSGGERQRVRIALLLAQSPQYYLLDEPLQHLDLRHQFLTMTMFREMSKQDHAVLMVLHDIHWLNTFCDHVLMLFNDGRSLAGRTKDILNQSNLEMLYQCRLAHFSVSEMRHLVLNT